MPIGNGDIALNAWTEADGDLLFYIAKSDAVSENSQLLKLGRACELEASTPESVRQRFAVQARVVASATATSLSPRGKKRRSKSVCGSTPIGR